MPRLRHCSASSLPAACFCCLILGLWCASTTPACLYSRLSPHQICEWRCLYDLDLMPTSKNNSVCENNSDDNCISNQYQAQQHRNVEGVDLEDREGDLVMAEGGDMVIPEGKDSV
ncbi:hypothetical protein N665_1253s0004 [Sinapis alba]|nr:hypothetical protein N665_1253s0004 [Sinapis alba]